MNKKVASIYEIADLNSKSITKNDTPDNIYYLDTSNIIRNCINNLQYLQFDKEGYPSRAKRKVKDRTIIYSTVRPNQEHFGILNNPTDNIIVSTGFTTIDVKDVNVIDPLYLYYYITQKFITNHLQAIAENSVSSYPSINPSDIGKLIITFPAEIQKQQKNIALLSAIDKKIELNNRINAELEAMAKTLYDYWFVQFDFPNEEGKPYKNSGGKMVYNTTLKREIPEGWLFKRLSSFMSIITDTVDPEKSAAKIFKYFSIPQFDENKIYKKEYGCNIKSSKFRVTENDLLVSKLNPWFNRVVYPMAGEDQICSTEFVVLRTPDFENKSFLYSITTSKPFIDYCSQSSTGTSNSHKRIDPKLMISYAIPYQQKVIEKFSKVSNPIIRKIIENYYENARLTSLRNWLLPMLMNGQVTIK
jgi:type I restriction enzyme, S subunit